jgi:hypothetical protein
MNLMFWIIFLSMSILGPLGGIMLGTYFGNRLS